ncbi:MAG: amidophosphoribosyltransferase [Candidatus Omnitrophota bacterium]
MGREVKECCGLFGVYNGRGAARIVFYGLYSLQHRGEESCGIFSFDGIDFRHHRGMGLVSEVFPEEKINELKGHQAIGHVRYSTTGSTAIRNIQPLFANSHHLSLALAHNGNLVNSSHLRRELEERGSIFQSSSDSEIILHLIMRAKKDVLLERIVAALTKVKGAYSLLIMDGSSIIGIRDPFGFRPLCIGRKDKAFFISSESCALDLVGAKFVREVKPGEIVTIDKKGMHSRMFVKEQKKHAFCVFEQVYFARPDSIIFNQTVHLAREKMGAVLAKEHPTEADCVVGVPDSGASAALGFAKACGIPLEVGIIRNHYIGRTFIQPYQEKREFGVKLKFNLLKEVIKNKRVVIVDDSIVRGTTSRIRVRDFRKMGAKEVHLRISCPPHRYGCVYGIDFPDAKELIANKMSFKEIEKYLGVDSIAYLSIEGMLSCLVFPKSCYCLACWDGSYPVKFHEANKYILEDMK